MSTFWGLMWRGLGLALPVTLLACDKKAGGCFQNSSPERRSDASRFAPNRKLARCRSKFTRSNASDRRG